MNKGAKKTLIKLIVAVPLMFAFGFALVPLYDVFCEVTGLNGKVFQSEHSDELVVDDGRQISLQFISTNNENMPWTFKPSDQVMDIQTGKYLLLFHQRCKHRFLHHPFRIRAYRSDEQSS